MKLKKKAGIIAVFFCIFIVYFSVKFLMPEKSRQESGYRHAPDFELPDFQGKKHKLEEFKGNLVLLHFWASWCPPCLAEIPQWIEIGGVFKQEKIKLVAVSLDQSWDDALKILPNQQLPPNVISLLDMSGKIPEAFGSFQYPETYLISPDLRILTKWVGPQDWGGQEIRDFISKLLKSIKS